MKRLWEFCHGAKNFFSKWHENLFLKSYSEMYLKKVMYNQHDFYMHTPISAFACYDTPLQASYQSDTCKSHTLNRRIKTNAMGVCLSCHLPLGSLSVFLFWQSSTDKPCVSVGLVPRLASPHLSSVRRVTTSRTTSTLHDFSPPLLSMFLVNIPA